MQRSASFTVLLLTDRFAPRPSDARVGLLLIRCQPHRAGGCAVAQTSDEEHFMLYELPEGPAVILVGPEDTPWWTELGMESAGRYALVIGGPTAPRDAQVITGSLQELAGYLADDGPLARDFSLAHALLQDALTHNTIVSDTSEGNIKPGTSGDDGRHPTAAVPAQPVDMPDPAVELVTLPHTGIRVPSTSLRITAVRDLASTPDGGAYTATLQMGAIPVGHVHNEGWGGPTTYDTADGSPFDLDQLAAFVAASRDANNEPLTEDGLLEELVTEYEGAAHVAEATRLGRSAIRLQEPLGEGDGLAGYFVTAERGIVPPIVTPVDRDELTCSLQRRDVLDGSRWQLWTGQRWEGLPPIEEPLDSSSSGTRHDCEQSETLRYVAEFGAPGFGQCWKCSVCEREWARLGGLFVPVEAGAHILSPHDVR
jgi:hypothetical protein